MLSRVSATLGVSVLHHSRSTLNTHVARDDAPHVAVVELELELARDHDSIVERNGTVGRRGHVGRKLDDAADRAGFVVQWAAERDGVGTRTLGGEGGGLPGNLEDESAPSYITHGS